MDMLQYQREAQNTKSPRFYFNNLSGSDLNIEATKDVDIFHACLGLCTEAGEVMDPFKKSAFYGKPVDFVNLDEEIGDILWYIAIYAEARGTTIEALAERNNRKLKQRFPDKFTQEAALNRDLFAERQVLEEG